VFCRFEKDFYVNFSIGFIFKTWIVDAGQVWSTAAFCNLACHNSNLPCSRKKMSPCRVCRSSINENGADFAHKLLVFVPHSTHPSPLCIDLGWVSLCACDEKFFVHMVDDALPWMSFGCFHQNNYCYFYFLLHIIIVSLMTLMMMTMMMIIIMMMMLMMKLMNALGCQSLCVCVYELFPQSCSYLLVSFVKILNVEHACIDKP
jgi:hypothetical protein